jgi:hypothetical protein
MDVTKIVTDILTDFFKTKDYKKGGKSWYKKNDISCIICQYQKSSFSNNFYLNFGIAFIGLLHSPKTTITTENCHLFGRYEQILGDNKFIIQVADITDEDTLIDVLKNITNNIDKFILPFLSQMSNIEYLKNNFPHGFDYKKLTVQNIKSENLTTYLHSFKP